MQAVKKHPFITQFYSSNSASSSSSASSANLPTSQDSPNVIINYSVGLESFICSIFPDESNRFTALLRFEVSSVTGSAYLQNDLIANLSVMGVELGNGKSSFFSMK